MCRGLGIPLSWGPFFPPLLRSPCEWILRNTEETGEHLLVPPRLLWLPEGASRPSLLLEKVCSVFVSALPVTGVHHRTPCLLHL